MYETLWSAQEFDRGVSAHRAVSTEYSYSHLWIRRNGCRLGDIDTYDYTEHPHKYKYQPAGSDLPGILDRKHRRSLAEITRAVYATRTLTISTRGYSPNRDIVGLLFIESVPGLASVRGRDINWVPNREGGRLDSGGAF